MNNQKSKSKPTNSDKMTDQEIEAYDAMMADRDHWKELMCELRDPNGTIWEHAKKLQDQCDDYKKQAVAGYKLRTDLEFWQQMDAQEMRLRCGEMSAQEMRTVRAVLSIIIAANAELSDRHE